MANLSIREAVKIYSVSRPTLSKDLKNGKISGVKDGKGTWKIDHSELSRVYTPRDSKPAKVEKTLPENLATFDHHSKDELSELKDQLVSAEQRAVVAEALAEERAARIEDLRRMLPAPNQKKRRWWQRQ